MKRLLWVCLLVSGFILGWDMVYAADVYVESSGWCGGKTPCYSTIQGAINAANSGDTIKLAQGIYAETFVLNSGKQLMTQGGWDAGFTTQTPRTTSIRAPVVPNGAIAFQELKVMEIAGPLGNATIADVLSGKTFSSDAGTALTGIMVNRSGLSYTPTTTDQTIAVGYYDGSGKVEGDADLVAGNIRSGVTIFGVAGSAPAPTGDAIVANVLSGKTFSNTSSTGLLGTMPNVGPQVITPTTSNQAITQGYHNGTGYAQGDGNLLQGNIKSGVNIFEVTGTFPSDGTATTSEVKTGETFYTTNSTKLTGTGTKALTEANDTVNAGYYEGTTLGAVDVDLSTGNIKAGKTIFGVSGKTEVVDTTEATNPVTEGRMKTGDVGFANGNKITGTGTKTLSAANDTVAEGYYAATTLSAVDTGLTAANIKKDVNIFGKVGTYEGAASVPRTGQTPTVPLTAPVGSDGALQKGVVWPNPRFTDNSNGTVTDNLTGLIWTKNANCIGIGTWDFALSACSTLADGHVLCGLNDGSSAGEWRLPNRFELESLLDLAFYNPAVSNAAGTAQWLPDDAFTNLLNLAFYYWSSTTVANLTTFAWCVDLYSGDITFIVKSDTTKNVWAVRGGQ